VTDEGVLEIGEGFWSYFVESLFSLQGATSVKSSGSTAATSC
jgi:hypothetical protein